MWQIIRKSSKNNQNFEGNGDYTHQIEMKYDVAALVSASCFPKQGRISMQRYYLSESTNHCYYWDVSVYPVIQ